MTKVSEFEDVGDAKSQKLLSSKDLAARIWDYGESTKWGNGDSMLLRQDIQDIIDEWLLAG